MREQIIECEKLQSRINKLKNQLDQSLEEENNKSSYWIYKDRKSELMYWNKIYDNKCKGMFDLFCHSVRQAQK
jgi:hypothetical protein